ncbi:MAG: von Willebrand factor type A domain-containing protein [Bacteroidota bacterium]
MLNPNQIRVEELINYFNYNYPSPIGAHPFSISTEVAACPWNPANRLLHIGIKGKEVHERELPSSNLVFLIDVSGSMTNPDKLPLLQKAFHMLTNQLRSKDRIAMVVYAGASGVVLPSTSGANKAKILEALYQLEAGGSTAGATGLELAYQVAERHFIKDGNNRVILATDGDFNVGPSSEEELVQLIEKKRASGVYLSVLGFGIETSGDQRMEQLADNGNGQFAYIDNLNEARKVMIQQMSGTLLTIAKDVKLQLEFNPAHVASYRLIGYENRMLKKEDFNNDQKDAGDIGAGHTVTALYEIVPTGDQRVATAEGDLKYQAQVVKASAKADPDLLTMKLRYKKPNASTSQLLEYTARDGGSTFGESSENFRFSAAVASFGMLLRNSDFKGSSNFTDISQWASGSKGKDSFGHRKEFLQLVEWAETIHKEQDGPVAY